MSTAEIIMTYATARNNFTFNELSEYVRDVSTISDSGILWHIKKLIREKKLMRLSRGLYGQGLKDEFQPRLTDSLKKLYQDVRGAFPLIDICVYSGADISSMQHHISTNNALYVEVTKEATEAVFHWLIDRGIRAYHRPTESFMSDYVNLSEEIVIVKTLVTESPVIVNDGIVMPSLEKLMVDINTDADFYYLHGGETFYIMEHALNLFKLNKSKLLRYASRRGARQKMVGLINECK